MAAVTLAMTITKMGTCCVHHIISYLVDSSALLRGKMQIEMASSSWVSKLKGLDAYPKTIEEFKVRTLQGGLFSLVAFACMSLLLASELSYYLSTDTVDKMTVDGGRNTLVSINFDVDFPHMPCSVVAVESADMAGNAQHDIVHNIEKIPLDRHGQALTEGMRDVIGGALTNNTDLHGETDKPACGSCYSAGEPGECCDTCDAVKAAYARKSWMMPSLHTIAQCQEAEIEKVLRGEVNEGCRIKGALIVSKVAGRLYFAPSKFFRSGYLSAQDLVDATFKVFDTSHTIRSLSFGAAYPDMKNPLDNRQKDLPDESTRGSFQYFLKVVPTEYTFLSASRIITNQFSATEHFRQLTPVSDKGLPMVSFAYTFSPIMFRIEQYRVGFLQFLTSVCAIVGGVFTILGIMDSLAFGLLNKTSSTTLLLSRVRDVGVCKLAAAMHGQPPSLPPELWNLSVVILICGFMGWMMRLVRLMLIYLETRFSVQQNAAIHLKKLGPSLHVLQHASMWHFHQLLRTQLQVASTAMKRVRVPFEMITSSVKLVEETDSQQQPQMGLSVEVKSEAKCAMQVFWNVKATALVGACQSATSTRVDRPIKRRYKLNDIVPIRAARTAIHAVRSLPGKFYDMNSVRTHELLDDDNRVIPDSPTSGHCLAHLFVEGDSFRSCSTMERRKDGCANEYVASIPSELLDDADTTEAIESSIVATDCENENTPEPPVNSSVDDSRYACVLVIGSTDFLESVIRPKSPFGIKRRLSTRSSRLENVVEDEVLCQCIAIDFLPTPSKYRRVPVVVKRLHFTATDVFSSQEIFGRESNSGECVICLERSPAAILLPCRHLCVCRECLEEIDQCPICRAKFSTYVCQDS